MPFVMQQPERPWPALLAADRRGVASALFGVSALALLGIIGLATQAGLWYADYARLQTAADAASTAGTVGIAAGESATQVAASTTYILQQNGYVNGKNGVTVSVNAPPASGPNKGNSNAVEVLVSEQEGLTLAGLFLASAPTAKVRSVALYGANVNTCVLALGQNLGGTNTGQVTLSGGAKLNASGCAVGTNNTGPNAFYLEPSPTVTAETIVSSGGVSSSCGQGPNGCGTTLNLTRPYSQNHVATTDPLAAAQDAPLPDPSNFSPASGNCTTTPSFPQWNSSYALTAGTSYCGLNESGTNSVSFPGSGGTFTFTSDVNIGGSTSIASGSSSAAADIYINGALNVTSYNPTQFPAGTYHVTGGMSISSSSQTTIDYGNIPSTFYINGNLAISGSAQVDIPPGTYFINNGNLNISGGTSLTCSSCVAGGAGVTFVLMGNSPGIVDISGNAAATFSAPASSNYDSGFNGIAIYEPLSNTGTNTLAGSGNLNLQGAIYLPGAELNVSGGAGTSSAACALIVANTIAMSGSGYASSSKCSTYGYNWTSSGPTPNGVTIVE